MWIYVFVGIIFFKGFLCQDPCNQGNNRLLDEPNRSTNYSVGPNDPVLCDDRLLDEGWYRISENGHIATECPDMFKCGSIYPVWLNGTLPEQGERLNLSACQRGFLNCCEYTFTVEVQNCNDFYVFYLTTIPVCPGRYCIAMPISFSVLLEVEAFIPTYNFTSVYRQLAFRCQVVIPLEYNRYVFDITWYINNNEIISKNQIAYSKLNTDGAFYRSDWAAHPNGPKVLGFWVMCKMRARQHSISVPSPYTSSNAFYAGVRIERTSFIVKTGREVSIRIKSTVPVACVHIFGQNICTVYIELFSLKDQFQSRPANCNESLSDEEIQMSRSACGLAFDGTKWQNYHTFNIKTLSDQALRSSYKCAAKLIARSNIDTLWNNYQLPEIYIHVFNQEIPRVFCHSGFYPHMYTIDGGFLPTHGKGEFVLFRHRSKPIEVHIIQRLENQYNRLVSNCAIMFRAATDMFVIYGCNSPARWITRRLNCNSGQQYFQVNKRGQNYEVTMPTGTRIYVYVKTSWLSIKVYVSPSDWEQTEGLCGTYNGNKDDDFTNRNGNIVNTADFFHSWVVPGSQSLFIAKSRTETITNAVLYCSCFNPSAIRIWNIDGKQADCTWKESLPLCRPMQWKDTTCRNYGRTKREILDDFEFDVPLEVVKYETSLQHVQNIEWKNGWNEQKAVNTCESFLTKSKLFTLCSKLTQTYDVHMSTCVADIKISGSDVFLSSSLDSMKLSCMHEIRLNTTFWRPKTKLEITTDRKLHFGFTTQLTDKSTTIRNFDITGVGDISSLDIAEAVFNNDCLNDCSGLGLCQQGICECVHGFQGDDCSVDRDKGPEVFGLIAESFCDSSKRPCSFISVFGNGFYETEIVKCRIKEAHVNRNNKITPGILNFTTKGSLISFAEVKCPLYRMHFDKLHIFPVLDAYLVSVSLDEIKFSTDFPIIVYDSSCTDCKDVDGSVDCIIRADICIVERKCYNLEHDKCRTSADKKLTDQTRCSELLVLYLCAILAGFGILTLTLLLMRRKMLHG